MRRIKSLIEIKTASHAKNRYTHCLKLSCDTPFSKWLLRYGNTSRTYSFLNLPPASDRAIPPSFTNSDSNSRFRKSGNLVEVVALNCWYRRFCLDSFDYLS
jgi:hypothetical protein